MMKENQSVKETSNFLDAVGTGTISLEDGKYRDTLVFGYFKRYRWWFIVHCDVYHPDTYIVSEASTGRRLTDYCYFTIEQAISEAILYIESKKYYFATTCGDILVKTQCNLLSRNTTNLQTLAINSLCL